MVSRIHGNCKEEIKARLSRASRSACLLHKRTLGKTKTRDSVKNIYIYIKFICDPRFTLERTKSIKEREREREGECGGRERGSRDGPSTLALTRVAIALARTSTTIASYQCAKCIVH
jgi:hypothetical protein